MIEIFGDETLAAFRAGAQDAALVACVEALVARAKAQNFWHLSAIIIVRPDDPLNGLADLLGFDPQRGPLAEPGSPFEPWWDWLVHHDTWLELGTTAGDSGFAWHVLVQPDSELGRLATG